MSLSKLQQALEARIVESGSPLDFKALQVLGKGQPEVAWSQRLALLSAMREGWVVVKDQQGELVWKGSLVQAQEVLGPRPKVHYGKNARTGEEAAVAYGSVLGESGIAGLRLAKVTIPRLDSDVERQLFVQAVRELLRTSVTKLAYVGAKEIVLCASDEADGWAGPWTKEGATFVNNPKLGKRLKRLVGPKAFTLSVPGLRVKIVDNPADEKLLDGIFALRRSVGLAVIEEAKDSRVKAIGLKTRLFNATVLLEEGLLKGNCCLVDDDKMDGYDVITHAVNIKREVSGFKVNRIGLDPQPPRDHCRTNLQAMLSLPQLFPEAEVMRWVDEHLLRVYRSIKNGELLDSFEELYFLRRKQDGAETQSSQLWLREMAVRWAGEAGLTFLHSPTLAPRLMAAHCCGLRYVTDRQVKITVPVPYASDEQVVSESAARMCGFDVRVKQGKIRRVGEAGFHAVSDADWLEMLPSHGGCDQDDHFMIFRRNVKGLGARVIVMRNPSDLGEYSVFSVDEGGTEAWPTVDLSGAVRRTSEALRDGTLVVTGLPQTTSKEKSSRKAYGVDSVIDDLRRSLEGVSPGLYVNAKMVRNYAFKTNPQTMLASMEDAVDACTQGGDVEQVQALKRQAEAWWIEVVQSGLAVDRLLWNTKAPSWIEETPLLEGGFVTRIVEHIAEREKKCVESLRTWAQENGVAPPMLAAMRPEDKPGWDEVKDVKRKLRTYRELAWQLAERGGDAGEWEDLQKKLLWMVGETDVCLLAWVIWDQKSLANDSVLWTKSFFAHYCGAMKK